MSLKFQRQLTRIQQALEQVRERIEADYEATETLASEKEVLVKENWNLRRNQATQSTHTDAEDEYSRVIDTLQNHKAEALKNLKNIRAQLSQIRKAVME